MVGITALLFLLSSCSYFQPRDKTPKEVYAEKLAEVKKKKERYCDLAKPQVMAKGYAVGKCDGLLFTSLHNLACGYPALGPFIENGRTYRSPTRDCFLNGKENGATSSTSKDMVAGYGLNKVVNDHRSSMGQFMKYCRDNPFDKLGVTCKIGDSLDTADAKSKVIVPIAAFWRYDDFAKGKTDRESTGEAKLSGIQSGFRGHLDVLGVLTDGGIYGGINADQLDTLSDYASANKNNALYEAAYRLYKDGDMNRAADLLLDQTRWPVDRLPSSNEMCTDYLYQRDEEPRDWAPCPKSAHVYDGTDFVFAASVLLGEIK